MINRYLNLDILQKIMSGSTIIDRKFLKGMSIFSNNIKKDKIKWRKVEFINVNFLIHMSDNESDYEESKNESSYHQSKKDNKRYY